MKINKSIVKNFITSLSRPLGLIIETSSLCNANCTMCPRDEYKREVDFIDMDLFKKIILDAKDEGITVFQVNFYGECLIDNSLSKKIDHIRTQIPNAWVQICTNGSLLSKKKIKELLDTNISEIRVSIEGNNNEEFNKIRLGLDYKEIVNNIKNLSEERNRVESKTQIVVTGLHIDGTLIDEDSYKKFWSQYADKVYTRNEFKLNQEANESIMSKLLPCDFLFRYLPIFSDGNYPICNYDWMGKTNYGNIKNTTIKQAWFKKRIVFYRLMHLIGLKRQLKLCNTCGYRPNYNKIIEG